MGHDVFISYSSHDTSVANAVSQAVESKGLKCWIAPRDLVAGEDYQGAIVRAIAECSTLILIFSAHSNVSPQVQREVERAVSRNLTIIPFVIEDVPLSAHMEFAISAAHRLVTNLRDWE